MPTSLKTNHEPKVSGQRKNHAIRKSRSVGGDIISSKNISKNNGNISKLESHTEEETVENNEADSSLRRGIAAAVPSTGLLGRKLNNGTNLGKQKGLGGLFKWFKNDKSSVDMDSNQDQQSKSVAKIHKNQGPDLIGMNSNGVIHTANMGDIGSRLSSAGSVDSICSLASTASFAYVPIGRYKAKNKEIPIGLNCSKETYRKRTASGHTQRNNNINLSTKYQLLPADYSPPTLRRKGIENFSAISGPSLPSGPHLPNSEGTSNYTDISDDEDGGSDNTLSDCETPSITNYSGMVY